MSYSGGAMNAAKHPTIHVIDRGWEMLNIPDRSDSKAYAQTAEAQL